MIEGLVITIIIALMIAFDQEEETDLKIIITTITITHKVVKEIDLENNTETMIKIIEIEIDLEIGLEIDLEIYLEIDHLLSISKIFILLILQMIIAINNLNHSSFKNYYR